jgi:hypothetical protein
MATAAATVAVTVVLAVVEGFGAGGVVVEGTGARGRWGEVMLGVFVYGLG